MRQVMRRIPGVIPVARAVRKAVTGRNFTPIYNEDCLVTNHWLTTDARFEAAYQKAGHLGLGVDPNIKWRAHVICWAAKRGLTLGGAFVECGVNLGFLSRIILDYLDDVPDFYLLDTFNGFDPKTLSAKHIATLKATANGAPWQQGRYSECYEDVVRTFADKPQVKIIRGTVPDTLPQVKEGRIAYLSLDMNCALPEIAAINYFWPKLAPGAAVVLDDYGHPGHEEQREAFDVWSSQNAAPLMSLPTGQGLIIKGNYANS